jgi:hypothetical protein
MNAMLDYSSQAARFGRCRARGDCARFARHTTPTLIRPKLILRGVAGTQNTVRCGALPTFNEGAPV